MDVGGDRLARRRSQSLLLANKVRGLFRDPHRWLALLLGSFCCLLSGPLWAADQIEIAAMFRSGKYADCVAATHELLEENGLLEGMRVLKLKSELTLGRYDDALKTLDAGLEKSPNSLQLRWLGLKVCRLHNDTERATKLEAEMVELLQQSAWRYTDSANQITIGRWMLSQHVDAKKVLTSVYNEVKRRQPLNFDVQLAIGDLALEKHDYKLAGEAFQQAVKLDPAQPEAHFGIAQAFAGSDSERATAALAKSLELNPHHISSLLMLADEHIDAERYEEADKALALVLAVNPHQSDALSYGAVLAHLRNQPEKEKELRAAALKHWSSNPAVDHLIGRKLSAKYRFAEGAEYQRQALKLDPQSLEAKAQLAQDLLRLGQEEEGLQLAEAVFQQDGYNVLTHNLVTLQANLAKFRTLEADGLLVRMDAREAEIYGDRVLGLLKRAKHDLCAKYDVTLEQPIIVEMFPRQQDFAIRTFGLPGGSGFLGVCFGTVITATSPAAQGASPSCWEATLWHEFCHVVTLSKTKNKMPRWLSEGISVYEERQANKSWGQAMNPRYREMILGTELTPVSQLSGAFLSPKSALHLQFAYYESSLVVEYLVEKYGLETLQRVLVDLGVGMPINESLARYTGSIDALDDEFAKYARQQANALAPNADWSALDLPRRADVAAIEALLKEHPTNYAALARLAQLQIAAKDWPAAKETLEKMRELYPDDGGGGNPYSLLASVYRELGENKAEREVLVKLCALTCDDLSALERLGELTAKASDWEASRQVALQSLAVNPLVASTHRRAAEAAKHLKDQPLAIASYQALLQLDPFDPAELHFELATAYQAQGELAAAKRHVLFALAETPRYRAAQHLLLKLVEVDASSEAQPAPETPPADKPVDTPSADNPPTEPATSLPAPETPP